MRAGGGSQPILYQVDHVGGDHLAASPLDPNADSKLVERAAETALLRHTLRDLLTGESSFVVVSGEPGSGRSALLQWAVASAKEMGVQVVSARATCAERDLPLGLAMRLRGALHLMSGEPADLCDARVAHRQESFTETSFRLCRSVVDAAVRGPVLVVVDDLHWADQESQRLIQMLVRCRFEAPIVVVAASNTTHRSYVGGTLWPAIGREIRLRGLSPQGVASVVLGAFDAQPDDVFTREAARLTRGNPAVLSAALSRFILSGSSPVKAAVEQLASCAALARGEQVLTVLDGLPTDLVDLVRAVAVCHHDLDIDLDLVLSTAGFNPATATGAVYRLLATGLVSGCDRLRMVDDASTEGVLASMKAPERHRLFTKAAVLGHRMAIPDESLARILLGAPVIGELWTVDILRGVAAAKAEEGDLELASQLLGRALREPLTAPQRAWLMVELAMALLPGSPEASHRLLEQVVLGASSASAPQALLAADLLLAMGDVQSAQRAIASAIDKLESAHPAVVALTALHHLGDDLQHGIRQRLTSRVPKLADPSVDPALAGVVAWRIALRGRDLEQTRTLARSALGSVIPAGALLMPRIAASMALMLTEDFDECAAGLYAVLADARRRHIPMAATALALAGLATLNMRSGNLDSAHRDLRAALVELPDQSFTASVRRPFIGLNAVLHLERGDVEKAQLVAFSCGAAAPEAGVESALLLYARGMVRLTTGDSMDASHLLLECGRLLLNKQLSNPAWLLWRSAAAKALLACGEATAAIRLVAEERQLAAVWGATGLLATADLAAGALSNGSLTTDAEAEVVRNLRPTPYRLRYAEALIELARAKVRCGENVEAAALLHEARFLARAAGARGLAERAGELLSNLDKPDALAVTSWTNLPWPKLIGDEARVVDLVRSGLGSTQIALALSVNRRTVERHLATVSRKLGLSGYEALQAMLTGPESRG